MKILTGILVWLMAVTALADTSTDPISLAVAPGEYEFILRRPLDPAVQTAVITLALYDWDTTGEGQVVLNGTVLTVPTNILNNNIEATISVTVPTSLLLPNMVNRLTFTWPRDVAAGRTPGTSYQIRSASILYTVAPTPVATWGDCRWAYRPGSSAQLLGSGLFGCKNSQTLERTTWVRPLSVTLSKGFTYLRALVGNNPVGPEAVADATPGTPCDAVWLWADDEPNGPNGEPGMTRQQKIDQVCVDTP